MIIQGPNTRFTGDCGALLPRRSVISAGPELSRFRTGLMGKTATAAAAVLR